MASDTPNYMVRSLFNDAAASTFAPEQQPAQVPRALRDRAHSTGSNDSRGSSGRALLFRARASDGSFRGGPPGVPRSLIPHTQRRYPRYTSLECHSEAVGIRRPGNEDSLLGRTEARMDDSRVEGLSPLPRRNTTGSSDSQTASRASCAVVYTSGPGMGATSVQPVHQDEAASRPRQRRSILSFAEVLSAISSDGDAGDDLKNEVGSVERMSSRQARSGSAATMLVTSRAGSSLSMSHTPIRESQPALGNLFGVDVSEGAELGFGASVQPQKDRMRQPRTGDRSMYVRYEGNRSARSRDVRDVTETSPDSSSLASGSREKRRSGHLGRSPSDSPVLLPGQSPSRQPAGDFGFIGEDAADSSPEDRQRVRRRHGRASSLASTASVRDKDAGGAASPTLQDGSSRQSTTPGLGLASIRSAGPNSEPAAHDIDVGERTEARSGRMVHGRARVVEPEEPAARASTLQQGGPGDETSGAEPAGWTSDWRRSAVAARMQQRAGRPYGSGQAVASGGSSYFGGESGGSWAVPRMGPSESMEFVDTIDADERPPVAVFHSGSQHQSGASRSKLSRSVSNTSGSGDGSESGGSTPPAAAAAATGMRSYLAEMDPGLDPDDVIPRRAGATREVAVGPLPLRRYPGRADGGLRARGPGSPGGAGQPIGQERLRALPMRCRVIIARVAPSIADLTSYVFMFQVLSRVARARLSAALGFARNGAWQAAETAARQIELQEHKAGDGLVVLFARMQPYSKTPYFAISTNPDDLFASRSNRSSGYAGKLRGDAVGHHYVLYDSGNAPSHDSRPSPDLGVPVAGGSSLRRELGLISFRHSGGGVQLPSGAASVASSRAKAGGQHRDADVDRPLASRYSSRSLASKSSRDSSREGFDSEHSGFIDKEPRSGRAAGSSASSHARAAMPPRLKERARVGLGRTTADHGHAPAPPKSTRNSAARLPWQQEAHKRRPIQPRTAPAGAHPQGFFSGEDAWRVDTMADTSESGADAADVAVSGARGHRAPDSSRSLESQGSAGAVEVQGGRAGLDPLGAPSTPDCMRVVLPAVARHGLRGDRLTPTTWYPSKASEGIVRVVADAEGNLQPLDSGRLSVLPSVPVPISSLLTGSVAWLESNKALLARLRLDRSAQLQRSSGAGCMSFALLGQATAGDRQAQTGSVSGSLASVSDRNGSVESRDDVFALKDDSGPRESSLGSRGESATRSLREEGAPAVGRRRPGLTVRHAMRDVGTTPTSPEASLPRARIAEAGTGWDACHTEVQLRCDQVGPCAFDVEVRSPLSMVQAFGIVLARLDSLRLACKQAREAKSRASKTVGSSASVVPLHPGTGKSLASSGSAGDLRRAPTSSAPTGIAVDLDGGAGGGVRGRSASRGGGSISVSPTRTNMMGEDSVHDVLGRLMEGKAPCDRIKAGDLARFSFASSFSTAEELAHAQHTAEQVGELGSSGIRQGVRGGQYGGAGGAGGSSGRQQAGSRAARYGRRKPATWVRSRRRMSLSAIGDALRQGFGSLFS